VFIFASFARIPRFGCEGRTDVRCAVRCYCHPVPGAAHENAERIGVPSHRMGDGVRNAGIVIATLRSFGGDISDGNVMREKKREK
jgi:hypothetical protein